MVRFQGSGRQMEGGAPATRKEDFNAHVNASDWRHTAGQIDLSPPLSFGATVQEALEAMSSSSSSTSTGYLFVGGDGYDNYAQDLSTHFTGVFASPQLAHGGIIIVKAGNYRLSTTVIVPNGISIVGEQGGVIIVGETSELPLFRFQRGTTKNSIQLPSVIVMEQYDEQNLLANVKLYDNLRGVVASGNPSMNTTSMIQIEHGANLVVKDCYFIGKAKTGPVSATRRAIGFTGLTTAGVGTVLHVDNNYFDGIKNPINFDARQGNLDYLTVTNNRSRSLGDGGLVSIEDRYFISMVNCNAHIVNNYHKGISTTWGAAGCILFKNTAISNTPTSMTITGNYGGLSSTASGDFINDARAVKNYIRMINLNNWGTHHSDDFIFQNVDDTLTIGGDVVINDSLSVLGGTIKRLIAEKDESDVILNTLSWSVKTEGGILHFNSSESFNYVDVGLLGIEDGDEVDIIWETEPNHVAPPYFYIPGVADASDHQQHVGNVRYPQPGKTLFNIKRIGDVLIVNGNQADNTSGYRLSNSDSGIGYKPVIGQLSSDLTGASQFQRIATSSTPSIFSYSGGTFVFGNWVHFNAGTLAASPDLQYWSSINTSGWLGAAPVKLVPWQKGNNQGLIINSGGAAGPNVLVHELTGRDLGVAGSYTTYNITGAAINIAIGIDDWFCVEDKANSKDVFYGVGRSTGICYMFAGGANVTQVGSTGTAGFASLANRKIASSNDGEILVYAYNSSTVRVSVNGGLSWSNQANAGGSIWKWVTYCPTKGQFCIVGDPVGTQISSATSRDGVNWQYSYGGNDYPAYDFYKVTTLNGYFFATGFGNLSTGVIQPDQVYWSTDGHIWHSPPGGGGVSSTAGFLIGQDRIAIPNSLNNTFFVSGSLGLNNSSFEWLY